LGSKKPAEASEIICRVAPLLHRCPAAGFKHAVIPELENGDIAAPTAPEEVEAVAVAIDAEAVAFDEPARFRAATARVLEITQWEAVGEIASDLAGISLDRLAQGPHALSRLKRN
jgi:hypothetical protein